MPATGVNLPDQQRERADKIAEALAQQYGVPVSRSAAIQKAIDHFFLVICPYDRTNDDKVDKPAQPAQAAA